MQAKSHAQARLMGAIAGGQRTKPGLSGEDAKAFLRGVDVSKLPERKTKRKLRDVLGY